MKLLWPLGKNFSEEVAALNALNVSTQINGGIVEFSGRLRRHAAHLTLSQPYRNSPLSPFTKCLTCYLLQPCATRIWVDISPKSVGLGRNDRRDVARLEPLDERVGVVALVSNHGLLSAGCGSNI